MENMHRRSIPWQGLDLWIAVLYITAQLADEGFSIWADNSVDPHHVTVSLLILKLFLLQGEIPIPFSAVVKNIFLLSNLKLILNEQICVSMYSTRYWMFRSTLQ